MSRWKGISLKYPVLSAYEGYALAIIVLAIAIRIWLIHLGWPLLDSDEGTMGLMGIHIAFHGETPIFFYGQSYMGAAEAYIAAALFHLFGISAFTLRLGMIFLFTLFLISMYLLTTLLFSKKWALITLLLLSLGSDAVLTRELVAVGGDAETLVSGTLVLLLATWLSFTIQNDTNRKRRLMAYAGWGLAAGFGLWSHLLVAPFVLMGAILLLIFCRKEIFNREALKCFSWAGLLLVACFIIGALPLIIYNIANISNPSKNIFSTFVSIHQVSSLQQRNTSLFTQFMGAFQISLPTATNASPLCSASAPDDAQVISFGSLHAVQCTFSHTIWPLGIFILWVTSTWLALRSLRPYWRRLGPSQWTPEERPFVVRYFARLSLLATSAITFALYVLSPNAALFPVATSRYLIGLLVTTPALLWPLWSGINAVKPLALRLAHVTVAVRLARISVFLRAGILLLVGTIMLLGTINTFTNIFPSPPVTAGQDIFETQAIDQHLNVPATRAYNQQEAGLIHSLWRKKLIYIYSDYWTCDRLIFQTKEHIICAPVEVDTSGKTIVPGHNRYLVYQRTVERRDPYATFVLQANSPLAKLMAKYLLQHKSPLDAWRPKYRSNSNITYKKYTFNGYVVYVPIKRTAVKHPLTPTKSTKQ